MKMTKMIAWLMALGLSTAATAGEMRLKSEVIGAESKVGVKSRNMDPIRGYGAAFSLESEVADGLTLGGKGGYLKYGDRKGGDSLKFEDSFAGIYASYDLIEVGAMSLYTLGGVSYHVIDFKDQTGSGTKVSFNDAYLWNYDVGLGSRYNLSRAFALSVEYRYSDTLSRHDTKAVVSNSSMHLKGKVDDLSLKGQQVAVAISYAF